MRHGLLRPAFLLLCLTAAPNGSAGEPPALDTFRWPDLPVPLANAAVARTGDMDSGGLAVFVGLSEGKTWKDLPDAAWLLAAPGADWQRIDDVPGGPGRLAATAERVGDTIYLFGGYTVAGDGSETSLPASLAFSPETKAFRELAPMPVPVDDALSFVYRDRFIYLVSGWHDTANVNLVQVYDTRTDTWDQATPYPGAPVFGHAGGIVDDTFVVFGGVRLDVTENGDRKFRTAGRAWRGRIDGDDPSRIHWRPLPEPPVEARYRIASTGTQRGGARILFAGGSATAYNYDGIGYDGSPAVPEADVFAWFFECGCWQQIGRLPDPVMDHRALIEVRDGFLMPGGLSSDRKVTRKVTGFRLPR